MNLQIPQHYPVACHTDNVTAGSTFVAIRGQKDDGARFIAQAIAQGASKIVVQVGTEISDELRATIERHNVVIEYVTDTRLALAELSARGADYPAKQLKIIGITGTKGKTTTSFLLEHILKSAGKRTALTGTVKNRILDYTLPAPLTTPQPDYLQQFLKVCVEQHVEYVVMEVAAQALTLHRVHGIEFDGIIYTNFAHEHLEFYTTLDDYFAAKRLIFKQAKPNAPLLINGDDPACKPLLDDYEHAISYGVGTHNRFRAVESSPTAHSQFSIKLDTYLCHIHSSHLMGGFNLYNIVAAVGMAYRLGIEPTAIADAVASFAGVPGRLERHSLKNGATCIIDYAHNPSSYEAVLSLLKSQTNDLIVVFGAGGGRDKLKRPIMGKIASDLADRVILTSDNPRYEDPHAIITDILAGIPQEKGGFVTIELDREQAIKQAYQLSKPGSIIAILGKGPDEYQIIQGVKISFSEAQIIQEL